MKIYHNPRCSKSRLGLQYLEEKGYDIENAPIPEKDALVKMLAVLNLQRNKCIDEIDNKLKFIKENNLTLSKDSTFNKVIKVDSLTKRILGDFGYFKKESDDLKAIHMFSTALKKGGILLLDYINVAAFNSENAIETETKTIQGIDFQIQKSYNANFLFKTIMFKDKGQAFEFQEEVKIIHLAKFKEYLSAQNLELIEVFGDYQLSPYLEDSSPRLILIARKK